MAYKLQVKADNANQPNSCGTSQRKITFEVGDWVMEGQRTWDNSQAWYHPLPEGAPEEEKLYLPLLTNGMTNSN